MATAVQRPEMLDAQLEGELLECVASLGQMADPSNPRSKYFPGEDCTGCVRDLVRYMMRQDPELWPVARKLGDWNIMSNHLVPLLAEFQTRPKEIFAVAKVMTLLTRPPALEMAYETKSSVYRYVQDGKQCFLREPVIKSMMKILVEPLSRVGELVASERRGEQRKVQGSGLERKDANLIELMLTLFNNVLRLPERADAEKQAVDMAAASRLQQKLIAEVHGQNLIDVLLYLSQNIEMQVNEAWNMPLLELWCAIFEGRDAETVAQQMKPPRQGTAAWREQTNSSLKSSLAQDKKRRSGLQSSLNSRHGQWGGSIRVSGGVYGNQQIKSSAVSQLQVLKKKEISSVGAVPSSDKRRLHDGNQQNADVDFKLRDKMEKLLGHGCNELLRSCRETIWGQRSMAVLRQNVTRDQQSWFQFAGFALNFNLALQARKKAETPAHVFDFSEVKSACSRDAIVVAIKECSNYIDEKAWPQLEAASFMLLQVFRTLQQLTSDRAGAKENYDIGRRIQLAVFSERDYLKVFPELIKIYNGKNLTRRFLASAVALSDVTLSLLKDFGDMTITNRRKKRIKHKVASAAAGENQGETHDKDDSDVEYEHYEQLQDFKFGEHVLMFYSAAQLVKQYCELMKDYENNAPGVNAHIFNFVETLRANQLGPLFYQMSLFCLFNQILKDEFKFDGKERADQVCRNVLKDFFENVDKDPGILGRIWFWKRRGELREIEKARDPQDILGTERAQSESDDESEEDVDQMDAFRKLVEMRAGNVKKARPFKKDDKVRLAKLHKSYNGLSYVCRGHLLALDLGRDVGEIRKQCAKLKLAGPSASTKRGFPKALQEALKHAEDEQEDAELGFSPDSDAVEKCLRALRKSLADGTSQMPDFATSLQWLAGIMRDAVAARPADKWAVPQSHAVVPVSKDEWRYMDQKWFKQTMLVLGLRPPIPAEGHSFWRIPPAATTDLLAEEVQMIVTIMVEGRVDQVSFSDDDGDLFAAAVVKQSGLTANPETAMADWNAWTGRRDQNRAGSDDEEGGEQQAKPKTGDDSDLESDEDTSHLRGRTLSKEEEATKRDKAQQQALADLAKRRRQQEEAEAADEEAAAAAGASASAGGVDAEEALLAAYAAGEDVGDGAPAAGGSPKRELPAAEAADEAGGSQPVPAPKRKKLVKRAQEVDDGLDDLDGFSDEEEGAASDAAPSPDKQQAAGSASTSARGNALNLLSDSDSDSD